MAELFRNFGEALRHLRAQILAVIHTRHTLIILSTILLVMAWGHHGEVELLRCVLPGWTGPGSLVEGRAVLIPGVPWDQEWLAFFIGVGLLVVIPCLIIHFGFKERLRDYGLGGPRPGQWPFTVASTLLLAAFAYPSIVFASRFDSMRAVYPLYRGHFTGLADFFYFELGYFAFFLVIEFVFRGYLLLGLYGAHHPGGARGAHESGDPPLLQHYSIVVSMLSYTAWHLGKPLPELWGTPIWGIVTGAIVIRTGTLWPVLLIHWSMNVVLDYLVWRA